MPDVITMLADIIHDDNTLANYVAEKTAEKSALLQSGIAVTDPLLNERANGPGTRTTVPYFKDLDGDADVLSEAKDIETDNIGTAELQATLMLRVKAFAATDLSTALSGQDPLRHVGDRFADYWVRQDQKVLMNVCNGIFETALGTSEHTLDASTHKFDAGVFVDAEQLLGDAWGKFSAVGIHSLVMSDWRKADLIDYIPDSQGQATIPVYMGRRVIVDDGCPVETLGDGTRVASSYIFGAGAFAYGEGAPAKVRRTEIMREPKKRGGQDSVIMRRSQILHPQGWAFLGANVTLETPTNAELADPANWLRKFERKNVPVVRVLTRV